MGKSSKKGKNDKKHVIKDFKKKSRRRSRRNRRNRRNKTNKTNISDLYTYESPVTNLGKSDSTNSNFNGQNNVNVVQGLKDFLAVKK
jgi:hypothetical protein